MTGQWVDLLPHVRPDLDGVLGVWQANGDGLLSTDQERAALALPVQVAGSYDLEVDFTPLKGKMVLNFALPVGTTYGEIALGGSEQFDGLRLIDGQGVDDNPTTTPRARSSPAGGTACW